MRSLARLLAVVAAGLAVATAGVAPALAHGGEEGLVVEPPTAPAGGTVVVRGDVPTTSPVQLVLVASGAEPVVLATVADPTDGHFEVAVTLPPAATPGTSRLEARTAGALLAARGVGILPAVAADEGGRADQAEPVAAPTAGSASAVRPDAAALRPPVQDPAPAPREWGWPALGAAVAACAAALVATATRRRRAGTA